MSIKKYKVILVFIGSLGFLAAQNYHTHSDNRGIYTFEREYFVHYDERYRPHQSNPQYIRNKRRCKTRRNRRGSRRVTRRSQNNGIRYHRH